jgi:hypothetical protein
VISLSEFIPTEKIKTVVPCPKCKAEIELVFCESSVCPKCGTLVTVHPHKGGDEHYVNGAKKKSKSVESKLKKESKAKKLKSEPEETDAIEEEVGEEEEE